MAKGSQLAQLKSELSKAGLSRQPQSSGKKRKRTGAVEGDKDKKIAKLQEINQKLNPFDVKVTKLKHDVGGRKLKGVTGKPTQSKQAGLEQRKKTLLKEYEQKDRSGGIVDRRFGENDPTMTPEERMLERYTKERQRTSKGVAFNLEDEDELTHYGQSLSKMDDFDGTGLELDDEDSDGAIGWETVTKTHFGGFEDDEEEEEEAGKEQQDRKKSKAEVMAEVIAKSKEHKYQRQLEKQQDENTRHEIDQEFNDIRSLLLSQPDPSSSGSNSIPLGRPRPEAKDPAEIIDKKTNEDRDYDLHVRELALDRKAQPKDRTKTDGELALEAKEALEKAEKKRLKRMMGETDDGSDDDDTKSERRKKARKERGGDDLEDDFEAEDDELGMLGTGLVEGKQLQDDDPDESGEDGSSDGSNDERDSSEYSDGESESLAPSATSRVGKSKSKAKELPFTFPCPETHDEFLEIVDGVEEKEVSTIVTRIRTLYHPSLAEGNKLKLETLTTVLIDYILHITSPPTPNFSSLFLLAPHIHSLTQAYPIKSAQHFVAKFTMMQKNLTRGLSRGATSLDSKTYPSSAELALLYLAGIIWPTSDMNHPVVSPMRLLMGEYLGLGRIRSLKDLSSGMFLCTLFLQFEQLSKRLVPEVINFLFNAMLHLGLHGFKDASSLPGCFPSPDLNSELCQKLRLSAKKAKGLEPRPPNLLELLGAPGSDEEQQKADLLGVSFDLLLRFADMYKSLDGFIELFQPAVEVLDGLQVKKLSPSLQAKISTVKDSLSRMVKFSLQARKPLLLQAHKPIPIASYIPKFESSSSSYLRRQDPDHERAAASKLRHQYKQERKGAMRELRKDARFLAGVQQKEQQEKDRGYKERMNRVFNSLEGERAEQKQMEKERLKEKKRAGRK